MEKLRIHYFLHVDFEGLGTIEEWAENYGHPLSSTKFYKKATLPDIADFDWLIIMGGPMSVNDEENYPWLNDELQFIKLAIQKGKTVLGICLGSQLISKALGAKVFSNHEKEIGWFEIEWTPFAKMGKLFSDFEKKTKVFHWHGDTFDLPSNAELLVWSEGCQNQAYSYNGNVLALQFHLETNEQSINKMIENGKKELITGKYIQTERETLINTHFMSSNKKILFNLLDRLGQTNN
jgi:GMP synthase-like glutamine amidotransferase